MLSGVSTCSLRLLHRKLLYSCVNGSHTLQQSLISHAFLLDRAPCFISSARFNRDSNETYQRNGALKDFVSFTDVHHSDDGESQILHFQSDGKGFQVSDGEQKFSQVKDKSFALRMALARYSADQSSSSTWGVAKPVVSRLDKLDTIKDEEPATEKSSELKVLRFKSKQCLEYHSVVIRRRVTRKLLKELQWKIKFLHTRSVPLSQVQLLLKKRAFLSASTERVERVVKVLTEFFESNSIAFDVLTANAGILEQPPENLEQRLQVLAEFEVDREAYIKLGKSQGMLTVKLETIEKALEFLRALGLDAQARSSMIRRRPGVLRQSPSSMSATVDFFRSIGFCGPKVLKLLQLRPSVLGSSVSNNLMVKFKLLQERGFSAKDFISALRFITQFSNEKIIARYDFLRDQGLPPQHVNKILRRQPGLLVLSTDNLKTKLDFLVHTLKRDILEVSMFPTYLACSFERRIAPRFKALETANLRKSPTLSRILAVRTSVFKQQFNIPDAVEC